MGFPNLLTNLSNDRKFVYHPSNSNANWFRMQYSELDHLDNCPDGYSIEGDGSNYIYESLISI